MSRSLAAQSCVPCRGGVSPLDRITAEDFLHTLPDWSLKDEARRIERRYGFGDFAAAWRFVDAIGRIAEAEGHHPDIAFGWGYATVSIHTHKIKGLHENDFILAAKYDASFSGAPSG